MDLEFSNYMNSNQPFTASVTLLNPFSFTNPWGNAYLGGVSDPISVFKKNQAGGNLNNFITPTAAYGIDRKIRNGYVQQYNLSIQQQLSFRIALRFPDMLRFAVQSEVQLAFLEAEVRDNDHFVSNRYFGGKWKASTRVPLSLGGTRLQQAPCLRHSLQLQ